MTKIGRMYELYEQEMYRAAYSVLGDAFSAEDAVHDAFLRIIANRDKIISPDSPKSRAYAVKAARNAAIDIYRRKKRAAERECELDTADEYGATTDDGLCGYGDIGDYIALLPEKYRAVVKNRLGYGLSCAETAAVMQISENCVKKRYERAKKLLADLLENEKNRGIKHE